MRPAAVFIDHGRAVDAWSEREVVVVFGVHGTLVPVGTVERVVEEVVRFGTEATNEKEEVCGDGVVCKGMCALCSSQAA